MSYAHALMGLGQAAGVDLDAWRRDYSLAREAGIPVPVLKAIKAVESGGNPAAIRFEPHVFWRLTKRLGDVSGPTIRAALTPSELAAVPYTPGNTEWRTAHGLGPCRISRSASCTGSETNRAAFNRAFAVNPENAVRATSWGSGQVLGGHLLDAFGGDPRRAVDGFFANPTEAGERMIVAWWRGARRDAVAAANSSPPGFNMIARRYNGCGDNCAAYEAKLRTKYAEFAPQWDSVRSAIEAAGALAVSTVSRNPMTTTLVGAAVLGAGAAFAWWAYNESKVRRNRRRRRASRSLVRNAEKSPPVAISDWKKVDATLYRWRHPSVTRTDGRDEYRIEKARNGWVAYYVGKGGERYYIAARNVGKWSNEETGTRYESRFDMPRTGPFKLEKKLEFYLSGQSHLRYDFASAASAAAHTGGMSHQRQERNG